MMHTVRSGTLSLLAVLAIAATATAADEALVASPDGSVELRVVPQDGRLRFAVAFKGRPVVES